MSAQIEALRAERAKHEIEAERFRQELRWEPWKALAAFIAAVAAFGGAVLGLAAWFSQHPHMFGG